MFPIAYSPRRACLVSNPISATENGSVRFKDRASTTLLISTVIPGNSTPAYKKILIIRVINFGPEKLFYNHFYVGNKKKHAITMRHEFDQNDHSLEMRFCWVLL